MKREVIFGKYFCGNKISEYGLKNGYVDYATLAKSFDAVLNNDIIGTTNNHGIGYWDTVNGEEYYYEFDGERLTDEERLEKIEEYRDILNSLEDEESEDYKAIEERLTELEDAEPYYYEFYQFYIISSQGASILEDYTNETVWYNETLDMYVWGITHYGTSWDYVLTDIKCNAAEDAN